MDHDYKPVDCNFYDELEALAMKRKSCEITFLNNGGKAVIHAAIEDLYTRDGVEYLKSSSGLEIRLDHLIQVDGIVGKGYC
jgi:Rho-binding antiterminator